MAISIISGPAHTRHSLLANAIVFPCLIAVIVGFRPAAPTIAAMVMSTGRLAASVMAFGPAAASIGVFAKACFKSLYFLGFAMTAIFACVSMACFASFSTLLWAVRASIW